MVLDYIAPTSNAQDRTGLAGNSIATDRGFIARDMPTRRLLHYRMIDVSSIKELCRRWYPRDPTSVSLEKGWRTAPWPTSTNRSASCSTTGVPPSCRSPGVVGRYRRGRRGAGAAGPNDSAAEPSTG